MQQAGLCSNGCGGATMRRAMHSSLLERTLSSVVKSSSGSSRGVGLVRFAAGSRESSTRAPVVRLETKQLLGQSLRSGLLPLGTSMKTFKKRQQQFSTRAQAGDADPEKLVATKIPAVDSGFGGSLYPSVAIACLGAILFGYHLGVVNGALEYISTDLGIAGNAAIQGWVVSITLVGATLGSFTGGLLADKFGRKGAFQLDVVPLIVGAFLSATATGVQAMLIGRFLVGLGIGISSAVVPLYIAEISPTSIRGSLGSVNQLSICIGILLALIAGLPLAGNPIWWKTMFAISAVPAALLYVGMIFSPESPRWLYQQGKKVEAENAIQRLWGKSKVQAAVAELESSSGSSEEAAGWGDLFSSRYRKIVGVGAILFLCQQFAGINAVVYYSTAVFRSAGIKSDVAASALVGAANVLGTFVASTLIDNQGRKKLLVFSYSGMAVSMGVLSLALSWPALAAYSGALALIGTVSYVLAFSLGAGPIPGLLLPEIFPSRIRATAVALCMAVHWICNFVIGITFLPVVTKYGVSSVYVAFASVCLLSVFYVSSQLIETKGRSLEEIERLLNPAV